MRSRVSSPVCARAARSPIPVDMRSPRAPASKRPPPVRNRGVPRPVDQEQAVNAFLTHQTQIDVHSADVVGFRTHPLNHYYITTDISVAE